jgi:NADP-dependent 3-hydroxy acid dehydrogenase YdfG
MPTRMCHGCGGRERNRRRVAKLLAAEGYAVVLARRDLASLAPLVAEIEQRGGSALAVAADAVR